jgi:hypothetical protein
VFWIVRWNPHPSSKVHPDWAPDCYCCWSCHYLNFAWLRAGSDGSENEGYLYIKTILYIMIIFRKGLQWNILYIYIYIRIYNMIL